jgi:gluconate 5-dehydrogenase
MSVSAKEGTLRPLFDLSGRVALITGGSRGLGLQIAEALGEFGATTILVARRQAELDQACASLHAQGVKADAIAADLAEDGAAERIAGEVCARHGRLDILVNNAGATWGAPAEDYPASAWDKVIALNVTGQFRLTAIVAARFMLPCSKGAVLNVASIEGLGGHHPSRIGTIAYNSSKGAIINMTRALAAEWGGRGVRVNALAPGFFPSKMTAATVDEHGARMLDGTPLGKLGGDQDLKGAALLLASDAGGHITGQVLVVDGGATII